MKGRTKTFENRSHCFPISFLSWGRYHCGVLAYSSNIWGTNWWPPLHWNWGALVWINHKVYYCLLWKSSSLEPYFMKFQPISFMTQPSMRHGQESLRYTIQQQFLLLHPSGLFLRTSGTTNCVVNEWPSLMEPHRVVETRFFFNP